MDKGIRFGTVQGRLIQPSTDELQWFPQNYWESEFYLAATLGLDYIELIAERKHNPNNPIWTDEGVEKIRSLCEKNDLSCYSICNDYIIDHNLIGKEQDSIVGQIEQFMARAALLEMKVVVLPFFEESEINKQNNGDYLSILTAIADIAKASNILICLETILDGKELIDLLEKLDHSHIKCVFDTGNRIAFGHDIYSDIRLLQQHIAHVHIKDKNANNQNVLLGDGLVNFYEVFRALSDIGYEGPFTFETSRGTNPLATASFHLQFCEFCAKNID